VVIFAGFINSKLQLSYVLFFKLFALLIPHHYSIV